VFDQFCRAKADSKTKSGKPAKLAKKETKAKEIIHNDMQTIPAESVQSERTNSVSQLQLYEQENKVPQPQRTRTSVIYLEDGLTPQSVIDFSMNTGFNNGEQEIARLNRELAKERAKNLALMSIHGLGKESDVFLFLCLHPCM